MQLNIFKILPLNNKAMNTKTYQTSNNNKQMKQIQAKFLKQIIQIDGLKIVKYKNKQNIKIDIIL